MPQMTGGYPAQVGSLEVGGCCSSIIDIFQCGHQGCVGVGALIAFYIVTCTSQTSGSPNKRQLSVTLETLMVWACPAVALQHGPPAFKCRGGLRSVDSTCIRLLSVRPQCCQCCNVGKTSQGRIQGNLPYMYPMVESTPLDVLLSGMASLILSVVFRTLSPLGASTTFTLQITGGPRPPMPGSYVQPQMTGGMQPPGPAPYTAQLTGPPGYSSGPPSGGFGAPGSGPASAGYTGAFPTAAGPTGQGLGAVAGPTGGIAGLPGFPPVSPADMQRYQTAFLQTDTDRDGLVKVRLVWYCLPGCDVF